MQLWSWVEKSHPQHWTISPARTRLFIDPDTRTNRLLIIGQLHQIAIIEQLINALDVPRMDDRSLGIYPIRHIDANKAAARLKELGILGQKDRPSGDPNDLSEGPRIVVLQEVNGLLIYADTWQHQRVRAALGLIDIPSQDLTVLRLYRLSRVDASTVAARLKELQIVVKDQAPRTTDTSQPTSTAQDIAATATGDLAQASGPITTATQITVIEAINALLVRATEPVHRQIQQVIDLIDTDTPQQALPYQIYFLENQSPVQLAETLGKIVQQTIVNKEGKIQRAIPNLEDQIIIVPDQGTFSIIVYASKTNQQWIEGLIRQLDRRRPQVLIDVTLVEIRRTDQFTYDLSSCSLWSEGTCHNRYHHRS